VNGGAAARKLAPRAHRRTRPHERDRPGALAPRATARGAVPL